MADISVLKKLAERFKEPSTWATISAALLAFGLAGPDVDRYVEIGLAVATIASLILGVFLAEGKTDK